MTDTTGHAGAWVAGYTDYSRDVAGAADATRLRHLSVVRRFIAACLGQGGPGWTGLSVQRVTEFIQHEAAQNTGHGRTAPACATRSFLRFLAWRGVAPSGLDRAIPAIRRARHASLPPHLMPEQLARLLELPAARCPALQWPAPRHQRSSPGGMSAKLTGPEHMPSAHRRYAEWTPERLQRDARVIGPATEALIIAVMARRPHPERGFRTCLGILRLFRGLEAARVEGQAENAKPRHLAAVEDVDYRTPRGLDRAMFLKPASWDWVRERRHWLLTGPAGVGKSWLACALGYKACRDTCRCFTSGCRGCLPPWRWPAATAGMPGC